jgi:hypothetical protein
MDHILELNSKAIEFLENKIFPSIYRSETILFLGAGSSVTNKRFLGDDIIEYFEDKLAIKLNSKDLVEFVDLLSAMPDFDRNEFDNFVLKLVTSLQISTVHQFIASIKWREIITTNYDLLIEKAFDEQTLKSSKAYKIKTIKSKNEYSGYNSSTEIKYVKLNGCASDKSQYPFVFSSKDFNDCRKYYRSIFSSLENLSPAINFLSIGFSFSDGLSNYLIEKFDSFNYRNKKWIYSIDPYVNEYRLPYYSDRKICILKIFPEEFFNLYNKWIETKANTIAKRKNISYTNTLNQHIIIPGKLKLSLGESLVQLSDTNNLHSVVQKEFYKGNRPTYDVIRKNFDVILTKEVRDVKEKIENILKQIEERIVPILFLEGHFGSGKSTFTYRVIHHVLHEIENTIAFEIIEPEKLSETDMIELFSLSKAKNIVLLCNELEVDSQFKELMSLRNRISLEQSSEFNVIFLSSIRENILSRQMKKSTYRNFHTYKLKLNFNHVEGTEFVEKLSIAGLLNFRDNKQKNAIINRVIKEFKGEPFISLLGLIDNQENHLEIILEDAYKQLSDKGREAIIYTSILYQFKILMPASILMKLISKDWDAFIKDIMEDDCKGILIQEVLPAHGSEPDLYFRTKHSLLSEHLVNSTIKTEDKLFDRLKKLISIINESHYTARLVINLLKALKDYSKLNQDKINKLYDLLSKEFESNQHFNLHYAINLQTVRRDESSLKTALSVLSYSADMSTRRNHRIIHRKAVVNFDLAKLYLKKERNVDFEHCINESRELFKIKVIEDPCSSYSYIDYISFEIWCLTNMNFDQNDLLRQHIIIQDLIDVAEKTVCENIERISFLKVEYIKIFKDKKIDGDKSLLQYLDELYDNESSRPYALVLKYNYLIELNKINDADSLIAEMEYFKYHDDIAKILFKHYGRNLHISQNIVKYFAIVADNPTIKIKEKLRFHFYSFIAEAYNRSFKHTYEHLNEIKASFNYLNPTVLEYWIDSVTNKPQFFEAIIVKNTKGIIQAKIIEFQQFFNIKKTNNDLKIIESKKYNVHLTFTLKGIRVEIINLIV